MDLTYLTKGINMDAPTPSTPRDFINSQIDYIFTTIQNCATEHQADSTLKMRLEVIRDNAQKAIDMLNCIEGAQQPEIYLN